jgi:hypothetical protein
MLTSSAGWRCRAFRRQVATNSGAPLMHWTVGSHNTRKRFIVVITLFDRDQKHFLCRVKKAFHTRWARLDPIRGELGVWEVVWQTS